MNIIESSLSINYPSAVVGNAKRRFTFDFDFDYDDSSLTPSVEDHKKLLAQSLRQARYWSLLCVPFAFIGSMRWYIWILYAQDLGQDNETALAFVVYACYFIQGIGSMFWATMGDKFGYDKVSTGLCLVNVFAIAIESIAPNFNILVIGTMSLAFTRGVGALMLAFIAKYLPNEYAIQYTTYIYAISAAAYLVGPVISGIIVHFFNFRAVYSTCAVILALCLIYIFCLISGSQKPLESKQMRMRSLYVALANSSPSIISSNASSKMKNDLLCENSQFPVCIERFGLMDPDMTASNSKHAPVSRNNISIEKSTSLVLTEQLMNSKHNVPLSDIKNNSDQNNEKQRQNRSDLYYSWFMMLSTLMANACLLGIEGVTSTYYLVYCDKQFNESIIASTFQIALFVLLFIVSCVITPPLIKCCNDYSAQSKINTSQILISKKSYNYEYGVLFVGHALNIPLYLYLWQRVQNISYMRWLVMCLAGIGLGITNMTQEVMLLELQPKQHAGKVSGAKIMARQFMKAFACLAVGVLWTKQIYWFLWVMGYLYAISLLLTCLMFFVQKCKFLWKP